MPAKKDNNYSEQQKELNRQIKERDFGRIYLICGEQDYLRTQNRDKLRAAVLGDGDAMNAAYFTGSDFTVTEVLTLAETLPFFAEKRVITLENTTLFGKAQGDAEQMSDYLEHVPETTCLIFVEEKPNKTTRLYKQIKKHGFVLSCDTPDAGMLRQWTLSMFAQRGHRMNARTLEKFLSGTGDDMLGIAGEVEKLSSYCYGREEITEADVQTICSVRVKDRIFDMISAIAQHNINLALEIYAELQILQTPPQVILSLMTRQFNQLLQIGELSRSHSDAEIAQMMGMNPYILSKRLKPTLRGYTAAGLIRALDDCLQADTDYKSGKIDPKLAVEQLIVRYAS